MRVNSNPARTRLARFGRWFGHRRCRRCRRTETPGAPARLGHALQQGLDFRFQDASTLAAIPCQVTRHKHVVLQSLQKGDRALRQGVRFSAVKSTAPCTNWLSTITTPNTAVESIKAVPSRSTRPLRSAKTNETPAPKAPSKPRNTRRPANPNGRGSWRRSATPCRAARSMLPRTQPCKIRKGAEAEVRHDGRQHGRQKATRGCIVQLDATTPMPVRAPEKTISPKYEPHTAPKSKFHAGRPNMPTTRTKDSVGNNAAMDTAQAPRNLAKTTAPRSGVASKAAQACLHDAPLQTNAS